MKVRQSFFKRVLSFFRPFRKYFIFVIGFMLLAQVISAFSPYLFGKGVDAVTNGDLRLTVIFLAIALGIALLQSFMISWIRELIEVKHLDQHIEKSISVLALNKMLGFSVGQHINEHSGVKQTIVNKGQSSLIQLIYNSLYHILPSVLQVIAVTGILTFFDWRLGAVATFFVVLYVIVSYRRNKRVFPKIDQIRKNNQAQSKLQSELYRNSTLVIAEAQEKNTVSAFDGSYEKVNDFTTNTWVKYLVPFHLHKLFIIFGQYITLTLGVYFIITGEHSPGMFVAFYSWIAAVFGNLIQIMNSQRQMLFQMVEIKKFFELLDIDPDIDPMLDGKTLDTFRGEIEFKNVSFAYPYRKSTQEELEEKESDDKKEDHAVRNINLKIPSGYKIGFVGVSGSGKSTIVNLMRRYYDPTEGEILIDGVGLKEMNLHWLRSRIGNVEQKIDLFDRSIRDNILFGFNEEVPEERLLKAVEDASLGEFIAKLKDHGLDTVIGEGGIKVSGGERQRIGIARALIKDPKILIFDEATSALDSINEKLIHDAINRSAEGRTTIIIAHRLSTVMDADIIFVVAEGKIVDSGTHKELEKRCVEYQKLIKNQVLIA